MKPHLSKRILLFAAFAILLQTTLITHTAAIWRGVKDSAGKLSSATKNALQAASSRVLTMGLGRERLFGLVESKLKSAGARVEKMMRCLGGESSQCDTVDRVILASTGVLIFVGIMALAGSTIGVAARSKLIENAKAEEAKKVTGYGPNAMAQRLRNLVVSSKDTLASLKTGIIKGELTRSQRNTLIGLGASIISSTLLFTAALIGLGIYSAKKEQQKAKDRQKQPVFETSITPIPIEPLTPEEAIPVTQPEPDIKKSDTSSFVGDLKKLSKKVGDTIEETLTPMQQYFEKKVVEKGKNIIQESAIKIKKLITERTAAAKKALKTTVPEKKEKLANLAKEKWNQAKKIAATFTNTIKDGAESFYNKALESVLGVSLTQILPKAMNLKTIMQRARAIKNKIQQLSLIDQIKEALNSVKEFKEKMALIKGNLSKALLEVSLVGGYKATFLRPVSLGGKTTEEVNQISREKFPLATAVDDVYNFYPQLISKLNNLKLGALGVMMESYLGKIGAVLDGIADLNKDTGNIGKVLISKQLSEAFESLGQKLTVLGSHIRAATTSGPIFKELPTSTPKAFLLGLKKYGFGEEGEHTIKSYVQGHLGATLKEYGFEDKMPLKRTILNVVNQMKENFNELKSRLKNMMTERDQYYGALYGIPASIKSSFITQLKEKPIKTTLLAPYYLGVFLGDAVSKAKKHALQMQKDAPALIRSIVKTLSSLPNVGFLINEAMGGEIVNATLIDRLDLIGKDLKRIRVDADTINEELKNYSSLSPTGP